MPLCWQAHLGDISPVGKPSRDKGARRERQVVDLHKAIGVPAERLPLSGAMRFRGNKADVDVTAIPGDPPFECEVKARANGEGFKTLEAWMGEADALFLIRDRATPIVVLPWDRWARLLAAARKGGE